MNDFVKSKHCGGGKKIQEVIFKLSGEVSRKKRSYKGCIPKIHWYKFKKFTYLNKTLIAVSMSRY